jgi:predicted carbohydrate-binding protein with CBM5 and CBM33 domain
MKTSQHYLRHALMLGATLLAASTASAHGYLVNSRAHLCNLGTNSNCGAIQWEPQSVEGADRYPESGPADGTLAAAGNPVWGALNEQNASRWSKISLQAGSYTFQWQFTAPHVTRDIRYWITKANWEPGAPLSRAQFEPVPFCVIQYGNTKPVPSTSERANHKCTLPARSGYHLILSVWDVSDTVNSFYSVMDAKFDGGVPPVLTEIGKIYAATSLPVGALASTRVFNNDAELPALASSIKINSVAEGISSKWPRALASAINAQNIGLQAGVLADGVVTPADGTNNIYALKNSPLTRVEVSTKLPPPDPAQEANFGIEKMSTTPVVNAKSQLVMTVYTSIAQTVDIKLTNKNTNLGVVYHADNQLGPKTINVALSNVAAGDYEMLMLSTYIKDGKAQTLQKTFKLTLQAGTGAISIYPVGLGTYVAGSKVQGRDGKVYVCLDWPYTSWCNGASSYYEPGFGSAWQNAWKAGSTSF